MRLVFLPQACVARPDARNGPLVIEPAQSFPMRVLETTERELQATLIAFSFSASVLTSES